MKKKEFIREITKKGEYSYYLILPKTRIDSLNWREGQKGALRVYGKNKILISDRKPKNKKAKLKSNALNEALYRAPCRSLYGVIH